MEPEVFVAGFNVEFNNGDNSYTIRIYYRDGKGQHVDNADTFTFTTVAKLKKFIKNTLLVVNDDGKEEVTSVTS